MFPVVKAFRIALYIPEHFRVEDHAKALAFMRANPFTILVSNTAEGPFASHLPLVIRADGDHLTLRGHDAKANPHWRYLEADPKCLTIFHGPHAYISPTNYNTSENVPTWNYATVHIHGNASTLHAPEDLLRILHELIPLFEPTYADQWSSLNDAYRQRMLSHIVGFEVAVTKIEAKFKLSQNRMRDEQQKVIESLSLVPDTAVSSTATLMREQGLGLKKEPK